ncbi:hypothetical protein T07_14843 [Trichinella nelsoni]|uniref:Uncharacterized protein n=1 Tax=Trichinella nelsoni TaxID=6336 RepID=A0A0V0S6Y2_9BILA|nr:hypothetical protein T07_14843 [Trichinella nelsoni]
MHWKNEMELIDEKAPIQKSGILFHVIEGEHLILCFIFESIRKITKMRVTWSRNVKQKIDMEFNTFEQVFIIRKE